VAFTGLPFFLCDPSWQAALCRALSLKILPIASYLTTKKLSACISGSLTETPKMQLRFRGFRRLEKFPCN
jgi:hypothetical protein